MHYSFGHNWPFCSSSKKDILGRDLCPKINLQKLVEIKITQTCFKYHISSFQCKWDILNMKFLCNVIRVSICYTWALAKYQIVLHVTQITLSVWIWFSNFVHMIISEWLLFVTYPCLIQCLHSCTGANVFLTLFLFLFLFFQTSVTFLFLVKGSLYAVAENISVCWFKIKD